MATDSPDAADVVTLAEIAAKRWLKRGNHVRHMTNDDLIQEAVLAVLAAQREGGGTLPASHVKNVATRRLNRLCTDATRRYADPMVRPGTRRREPQFDDDATADTAHKPASDPFDDADATTLATWRQRLDAILPRLPPQQRAAFDAERRGLSEDDAARTCGLSVATYRRTLRRATARLRQLAQQQQHDTPAD